MNSPVYLRLFRLLNLCHCSARLGIDLLLEHMLRPLPHLNSERLLLGYSLTMSSLFDCAFACCGPWIAIILAADIIDSVNATVTIAITAVLLFFAFSIETLFFVFIVVTVISSSD